MTDYYSTIQDVIDDSQVEPGDLHFETDAELNSKIESWLVESKSIVDSNASIFSDRKRDFTQELADAEIEFIPVCIHDIAKRIAINKVKQARINQDTSIVSKDDYTIALTSDSIVSSSILKDLEACVKANDKTTVKKKIRPFVVG